MTYHLPTSHPHVPLSHVTQAPRPLTNWNETAGTQLWNSEPHGVGSGGINSWRPGKVFFLFLLIFSTLQSFNSIPKQLQSTPAYQASSPEQFRGSSFWAWSGGPPALSSSPLSPGLNGVWLREVRRVLGRLGFPATPPLLPAYRRARRVPKGGPGSPSSLQWEGAEIQKTPWLGPLDKQAQGGCNGGGGGRRLQPCRAQTMQSGAGPGADRVLSSTCSNVLPRTRGNPFTSFSNKSIMLHNSIWPVSL